MTSNKIFTFKIAIITLFLLSTKYLISYYLNFNEEIFFKILKLAEVDFLEYASMVESISRLDFKFDWSVNQPAEKIQSFPLFSLIWHSIIFKFFGYYSFLLLEFFLYFFLLFVFFKVVLLLQNSPQIALCSLICLLFSLELFTYLINTHEIIFLNKLKLPIYDILSHRFPRPLLTSIYLFSSIYFIIKILNSYTFNIKKSYFFFLGISLFFLINSFFYLFITTALTIFITFTLKFGKKFLEVISKNFYGFSILFGLVFLGFLLIVFQSFISETSHFFRMGGFEVSLTDKYNISKIFLRKIFQIEILLLIILSLFFKFNYKIFNIKTKNIINYDILFYFFIASIISPHIFLLFSNKVIALNNFWSIVKFSGFLYVYLILFNYLLSHYKNIINYFSYSIFLLLIIINLTNYYSKELNFNKKLIKDRKELKEFLIINKFQNTNFQLYSNDETINHLWLDLNNKNILQTNGFILSQTDKQIENTVFTILKLFQISNKKFDEMLNERSTGRNSFSLKFKYKYSVNSIRHYKPLLKEYSFEDIRYIENTSPLIQWATIIPNSEKNKFLNNYTNFKIKKSLLPDIIIFKKIVRENQFNPRGYNVIFSNSNYTVLRII